jgi:GNAT superfamily N-acetyltransferase
MYRFGQVDTDDEDVVELLAELHTAAFDDDGLTPQADYEQGWWWVVTDGREAAGMCGLTQSSYYPKYGYLKRACVLRRHRGQGLQRRMLSLRERKARLLGFTHCITDTTENVPSANSLIGAGYRLFIPATPWAFPSTLYWRKEL